MNTKKRACNFTRSYTVIPQLCISPDASSTAFHNADSKTSAVCPSYS
ncbi:hypothetical protein [Megamonas hypermegale]|nr:hypothetical protein [Megamonas hypermegale]